MTAYGTDDNAYSGGFSGGGVYGDSNNLSGHIGDSNDISSSNYGMNSNDGFHGIKNGMTPQERLQDIERREQRAIELERELDEKEAQMRKQYKGYKSKPNWPIKQCAIARHNISRDIPSKFQNHVKKFYSLWLLIALSTFMNWLSIIWYGAYKKKTNFMTFVLLPILYLLVGCPCAWMLWYKRYYRAMQNNGNISYMFFIFFGLQILWCGINAVGFVNIAGCGVLVTFQFWINDSDKNVVLALVMSITTALWILSGVTGIWMVKLAHFDLGVFLAQKYAPTAAQIDGNNKNQLLAGPPSQGTGTIQNNSAWK